MPSLADVLDTTRPPQPGGNAVEAIMEVATTRFIPKIQDSARTLNMFEETLESLERVPRTRVIMPIKNASKTLNRASNVRKAISPMLAATAKESMAEALILVPKDTGRLSQSGKMNMRPFAPARFRLQVKMTFGDHKHINPKHGRRTREYAIYVHERVELKHDPPTMAKFLQIPVEKRGGVLQDRVTFAVKQHFRSL